MEYEVLHFDLGTSTEGSNHIMLALSSLYHSRKKKFTNILQLFFFCKICHYCYLFSEVKTTNSFLKIKVSLLLLKCRKTVELIVRRPTA